MTKEQRDQLKKPFEPDQVKTRTGSHGKSLDYLEGHTVVDRLNTAFDGQWSFVVESHEILQDEVIVLGKLTADVVTKHAFGGSRITRHKETCEPVCLSDDMKAAATDSLKKASTLMGVGLYLYSGEDRGTDQAQQIQQDNNKPAPKPSNINGARISTKQHKFVLSLSRDQKATKHELNAYCKQRYGVVADHLSREQASELIDGLVNDRINLLEKTDQAAA